MTTAEELLSPREAIMAGSKVWTSTAQVTRRVRGWERYARYEHERTKEDQLRAMMRELWMTEDEIAARYESVWTDPYSTELRETGEKNAAGEPVKEPVPVEESQWACQQLLTGPRRTPLPGAVYTVAVPLPEGALIRQALDDALSTLVRAQHPRDVLVLRLHPAKFTDFINLICAEQRTVIADDVTFNGVPVQPHRVPKDVVVAVYPLVR